jgi:glutamate-ammonia-ligase adenylyltransferase
MDFLPEQVRPIVERWFQRLQSEHGEVLLADDIAATLFRVVAASDFAGNVLIREWDYFRRRLESLGSIPDADALREFTDSVANGDMPIDAARSMLRRYRNRYLVQVLSCETEGSIELPQTLAALSLLADRMLAAAAGYAKVQVADRFGQFRNAAGEPVPFVILGMGKLGGDELNFSSDIDLVFLFAEEGESDGPRKLAGQQYFTRLSQTIVALLDEVTADGFVFRIDTRLRPFGQSGPPVISFAALESYLLRHGRDWERYAYVKARIVGERPGAEVEAELFDNLILPFVYRRYLDYGVFESLREMHAMIAAEVKRRDLADNVKLGPGGIREIEFIVQSLQLVRGGNRPELREASLRAVLPALTDRRGLAAGKAHALWGAYVFLRRVENFIQAMRDQQSHDLPTDPVDRLRLCTAMGIATWQELVDELNKHRNFVTTEFDAIAFRDGPSTDDRDLASRFAALWESGAPGPEWREALGDQPASANLADIIAAFRNSPATLKIDKVSQGRLQRFVPTLLTLVLQSKDPALALERTLAVIEQVLRRSAYVALLNENRVAAQRLVRLCERSAYIAKQIARFPALLDELLDSGTRNDRITKAEFEAEFEDRVAHLDRDDSEEQMEALAQFQRASLFRVAVADFSGDLPIMKVSDSLTYLAETVLDRALSAAWNDIVGRYGKPGYESGGEIREAGFGIIAYGKLGGLEMSYGSDLDLVFLHDSRGSKQVTSGEKPLDNSMFFARLVRRLLHFLTTQTSSGVMYEVDTRLRPDGRSGLLVTSTDAFEKYQEENAWTWEHQALLRARAVAGSASVSAEFERIRRTTLVTRVRRDCLHEDVVSMRRRMRKELDRSDAQHFDLKHGHGGIGDIEFTVQYLVLLNAVSHPAVIHYSDNIRQLAALASVGRLDIRTAARLQEVYRHFRLRLHHLSLNDRPPFVPASEFAAERDFVAGVWKRHLGSGS